MRLDVHLEGHRLPDGSWQVVPASTSTPPPPLSTTAVGQGPAVILTLNLGGVLQP